MDHGLPSPTEWQVGMDSVSNGPELPRPGTILVCGSLYGRALCIRKDEAGGLMDSVGFVELGEGALVLKSERTGMANLGACYTKVVNNRGEVGWVAAVVRDWENGKWTL